MTQNEVVWMLLGIIQMMVIAFVANWTRRTQKIEDSVTKLQEVMTETFETRTRLLVEFQGRVSKLEAQFSEIANSLARIERRLDRGDIRAERMRDDETEE